MRKGKKNTEKKKVEESERKGKEERKTQNK